jgi:DNA-binding MarR family transcriptional regulator/GNAT superfamily N-acetyltransferase
VRVEKPDDDVVEAVRDFTLFWTRASNVLREGLLQTSFSLTEARVLFELARRDSAEVAALRGRLGLNSGYLSRILARFEGDGMLTRARSASDARRQVVSLTEHGLAVHRVLESRSAEGARRIVAGLDDAGRRDLVDALRAARSVLAGPPTAPPTPSAPVVRPFRSGDLGWFLHRAAVLGAGESGWVGPDEAQLATLVAEFARHVPGQPGGIAARPGRYAAWAAELDGRPVGWVLCRPLDEAAAEIPLLLVEPEARSRGVGSRLLAECVSFARHSEARTLTVSAYGGHPAVERLAEHAGFVRAGEDAASPARVPEPRPGIRWVLRCAELPPVAESDRAVRPLDAAPATVELAAPALPAS